MNPDEEKMSGMETKIHERVYNFVQKDVWFEGDS